jgi:hypothetical protein
VPLVPARPEKKKGPGAEVVARRHPEYLAFRVLWQRALDSLEGGDAYRDATYGQDYAGLPARNLVRHKRETPTPGQSPILQAASGSDSSSLANLDDYELRRSRTPPPRQFHAAITRHLGKIYAEEIDRDGPEDYLEWCKDVDGCRTAIDSWMRDTVAELLLALGQLDILIDRPPAPDGVDVLTRADAADLGLDRAVAAAILPDDVPWWRLDPRGNYAEVLIVDRAEDDDGNPVDRYRHWTAQESVLYDADGFVLERRPHPYGRVPIVRLFVRKRFRHRNVGASPYEGVLDLERERYNVESEITLANVYGAHPLLQGPEDKLGRDSEIAVGPGWTLPISVDREGNSVEWKLLETSGKAYDNLRQSARDLEDLVDRLTAQAKPAGQNATTTAQSGLSKAMDQEDGSAMLGTLAGKLAAAERAVGELAVCVLRDGNEPDWAALPPGSPDAIAVRYPSGFNLYSADDLARFAAAFQLWLKGTGDAPEVEEAVGRAWLRRGLPGLTDDQYERLDADLAAAIGSAAGARDQMRETMAALPAPAEEPPEDNPADEPADDEPTTTEE